MRESTFTLVYWGFMNPHSLLFGPASLVKPHFSRIRHFCWNWSNVWGASIPLDPYHKGFALKIPQNLIGIHQFNSRSVKQLKMNKRPTPCLVQQFTVDGPWCSFICPTLGTMLLSQKPSKFFSITGETKNAENQKNVCFAKNSSQNMCITLPKFNIAPEKLPS